MPDLHALLVLQQQDTAADQLRHRRATLPERALLAAIDAELTRLDAELATATVEHDRLAADQERLEAEVAVGEDKRRTLERRLAASSVPREAQTMSAEIDGLKARQSGLEDELLELMEALEPIDARLVTGADERVQLAERHTATAAALAAAEAGVDAELAAMGVAGAGGSAHPAAVARSLRAAAVQAQRRGRGHARRAPLHRLQPGVARTGAGTGAGGGPRCHRRVRAVRPHPGDGMNPRRRLGLALLGRCGGRSCRCRRVAPDRRCCSGSGDGVLTVWIVFHDPSIDYRVLFLGAILPDLVDAPFGGAGVAHSVTCSVVVLIVVMLATIGHRARRRRWLFLPIGMFLHLVFDGAWNDAKVFWWPFSGARPGDQPLPSLDRGALSLLFEAIGLAILVWA
jgi:predicted  nucleic acid-binding Zn-ribbon protein